MTRHTCITVIGLVSTLTGCGTQTRRHTEPRTPGATITQEDDPYNASENAVDPAARDGQTLTDKQILRMLSDNRSRHLLDNMRTLASPESLPGLTRVLRNSETPEYVRKRAASVMGRIGSWDARQPLIEILAQTDRPSIDDGSSLWSRLITALADCIEHGTENQLLLDLRHENPHVRLLAAMQLGKRKCIAASAELIRLLDDEHPDPRLGATWALGEIEDPTGIDELIAIVEKRRTGGNRISAIEAMGKILSPRAVKAVKSVKSDDPAYWMAQKTLSRISQSSRARERD